MGPGNGATGTEGPDDKLLRAETGVEQTVRGTGPSNWWRLGILALAVIVALLLARQLLNGNRGTDVVPGTPVTAPQNG